MLTEFASEWFGCHSGVVGADGARVERNVAQDSFYVFGGNYTILIEIVPT